MRIQTLAFLLLAFLVNAAFADNNHKYKVTITNITKGQTFTPQLVVTHDRSIALFELGSPASSELEILAEAGGTEPLTNELLGQGGHVASAMTIDGLLGPGQSVSATVKARGRHKFLSFAAMLIPTNDTFVALNRVRLPRHGRKVYTALAYDAGTEENDQNCANIPGPRCGGQDHSPGPNDGDEGFVYVSNGFHELAGKGEILGPSVYDWRNPVARISVERVR